MKDKYKKMEPLKQITSFPKYQKDSYFFVLGCLFVCFHQNIALPGASLVVQWLRLCSQGRGPGFSPWLGN